MSETRLGVDVGGTFTDFVVLPHLEMWQIRPAVTTLSIAALLYGLVWVVD